ncbi:SDR family NAD(P)-dependent oxidoreductase [Congregibacter sp.]|uniref:SDR family NAD(P)-dependent oxidoreductase n=1 Tax=Congregibacter sp. TaxID=2744308 RepID=UPI00385E5218
MTIAIITGASVGIGEATARAFQDGGYEVVNLSRRACKVSGVHNVPCDLADPDSIGDVIDALLSRISGLSEISLIHNASQMRKDSADNCADDSLRAVMETNVIAANRLTRALLPGMGPGSSVLYVGSTLAEKAVPNTFSYVVSKHAQLGMMRSTCQDLMGSGIHTAMICPGFTDTEMLRNHLGNDEALLQQIGAMNSFGRLIEPEEIAGVLLWAHRNPVINGSVMHANLGQRES